MKGIDKILAELNQDIDTATNQRKQYKENSPDYRFWNGLRCQARKTKEDVIKIFNLDKS